jgi:hypothetical protein
MKYPDLIITYSDDVYEFVQKNEDGTLLYKTFSGNKINIKVEEIGNKYRIMT